MNYLAHLLLAEPTEDSRLGGLIGDFMRGCHIDDFSAGVRAGILRHRAIDRLTDSHPVFARSKARLPESLRRFAGVIADVFYDHFLAVSWGRWHAEQPLADFAQEVYAILERRHDELPPRLREALPWIVGEDWFSSYARTDHMDRVFAGMSSRVKRDNPLRQAPAALHANYAELAADFAEFFPQLRAEVPEAMGSAAVP